MDIGNTQIYIVLEVSDVCTDADLCRKGKKLLYGKCLYIRDWTGTLISVTNCIP